MKISSNDIGELANYLEGASKAGNEQLCYWSGADYFKSGDLEIFSSRYDASEFCYENTTDQDTYDFTLLAPVLKTVQNFREQLKALEANAANISFPFSIAEIEQQYRISQEFKTKEMENENVTNQEDQLLKAGSENNPTVQSINEKNLEYLENQLLKTGFGDIARADLIKNITKGKDSFQLTLQKNYGNDEATATLNFNKSDKGNYFFNNYDLAVKNEGETEAFKQRFKVNYGNTYTLKEAFNLMQGRSVYKEFVKVDPDNKDNNQRYKAWSTMDFKEADTEGNHSIKKSYKLNLQEALSEYPFKELANATYSEDLIDSLHRGNRQSVTYVANGKEEKMYVEANPAHNSLKLYDANMKPLKLSMKVKAVSETTDLKEGQGKEVKEGQNIREFNGNKKGAASSEEDSSSRQPKKGKGIKAA